MVAWADAYPLDTRSVELTNQVPRSCQIVPFSEDMVVLRVCSHLTLGTLFMLSNGVIAEWWGSLFILHGFANFCRIYIGWRFLLRLEN